MAPSPAGLTCFDTAEARKLERQLSALREFADEVQLRYGKQPDGGAPDAAMDSASPRSFTRGWYF